VGEIRRSLQEAAMGVSGQGEKSLSPKTQKNDNDNAIRKIINKRKINRILYLVFIVLLLLVIPAQGSNLATENQTSI